MFHHYICKCPSLVFRKINFFLKNVFFLLVLLLELKFIGVQKSSTVSVLYPLKTYALYIFFCIFLDIFFFIILNMFFKNFGPLQTSILNVYIVVLIIYVFYEIFCECNHCNYISFFFVSY